MTWMTSDSLHAILGPDPGAALCAAFLKANAWGAAAIVTVAAARLPLRRAFGPVAAYQLWVLPPIAATGALLNFFLSGDSETAPAVMAARLPHLGLLAAVWAVAAVIIAARFALAQARFLTAVRAGLAGPAAVGFISPTVVLPADDGRYSAEERELIRAHEREHVARKDPRSAAFAAAAQCLCWFNPLVHLAAHLIRLDQELACDAAVVRGRPWARALYARTLLKTQLAGAPLPFGCYWPARGQHPLEVRIAMLKPRGGAGAVKSGPRPAGSTISPAPVDAIRP